MLSVICCNLLHYTTQIILIKNFGDYDHPKKLNEKVVITVNNKYFYYATPIVVAAIAAVVSSIVYPILIANGCPSIMAISATIGFVAIRIIGALVDCYQHYSGRCKRHYFMLNDEEAKHLGIDLKNLEKIKLHGELYIFGEPPVCTRCLN